MRYCSFGEYVSKSGRSADRTIALLPRVGGPFQGSIKSLQPYGPTGVPYLRPAVYVRPTVPCGPGAIVGTDGSGLGLVIVKGIALLNGERCSIASQLGGTRKITALWL